jgi:hypothetical protein
MDDEARGDVREDAFHVTAAAHMAAILAEGFRTDRRGVLGTGAYFDLGSDTTGLAPARQRYPAQPLVVFRCAVAVGRVLDFDVAELRARFRAFQRQLIQHLGRDMVLRLGHGGHVDLFLEALRAAGERYHTVQRTFVTDGQRRLVVRDARRVQVLVVRDVQRGTVLWTRPDPC